jgi:hypothetical protein
LQRGATLAHGARCERLQPALKDDVDLVRRNRAARPIAPERLQPQFEMRGALFDGRHRGDAFEVGRHVSGQRSRCGRALAPVLVFLIGDPLAHVVERRGERPALAVVLAVDAHVGLPAAALSADAFVFALHPDLVLLGMNPSGPCWDMYPALLVDRVAFLPAHDSYPFPRHLLDFVERRGCAVRSELYVLADGEWRRQRVRLSECDGS